MTLEEAKKQLNDFVKAYENEEIRVAVRNQHGIIPENVVRDYEATKVVLKELGVVFNKEE